MPFKLDHFSTKTLLTLRFFPKNLGSLYLQSKTPTLLQFSTKIPSSPQNPYKTSLYFLTMTFQPQILSKILCLERFYCWTKYTLASTFSASCPQHFPTVLPLQYRLIAEQTLTDFSLPSSFQLYLIITGLQWYFCLWEGSKSQRYSGLVFYLSLGYLPRMWCLRNLRPPTKWTLRPGHLYLDTYT